MILIDNKHEKNKIYMPKNEYRSIKPVGETWITKHGCVYDLENKSFKVKVEEKDDIYSFSLADTLYDGKVADYLYSKNYQTIDYQYAKNYFEKIAPIPHQLCSSVRAGHLVGRHLDWKNDYGANIVVKTSGQAHDVIGVCGGLSSATIYNIDNDLGVDWTILPFFLQDGVNDSGLYASVNVVPVTGNPNTETTPRIRTEERVCALMLVRYILDNFDSIDAAIDYLDDYVQIYMPTSLTGMGFETHIMMADTYNHTIVLEIVNNELVIIENDICTNFHLSGVTFNDDGSVYTNYDAINGHFASENGIEDYGTGLERYNILNAAVRDGELDDEEGMWRAMDSIKFSNAYKEGWASEFVGKDITVNTPADDPDFVKRIEKYKKLYEDRSKGDESMIIVNRLTNKVYNIDFHDLRRFYNYYYAKIDVSMCDDGEYEYRIFDKKGTLATGILRIGKIEVDFEAIPTKITYNEYRG